MPEFAGAKVLGNEEKTLIVIGLGVGEDQIIDFQDAPLPEEGGYDILSHVEITVQTASIDHHAFAVGEFHKGAVPLSDIEKGRPEVLHRVTPEPPI